jgi:hypothetical protein
MSQYHPPWRSAELPALDGSREDILGKALDPIDEDPRSRAFAHGMGGAFSS